MGVGGKEEDLMIKYQILQFLSYIESTLIIILFPYCAFKIRK